MSDELKTRRELAAEHRAIAVQAAAATVERSDDSALIAAVLAERAELILNYIKTGEVPPRPAPSTPAGRFVGVY